MEIQLLLDFFLIFILMRFYQFDPHNYNDTGGYIGAFIRAAFVMGSLLAFLGMEDKSTDLSKFFAGYFLASVVAASFSTPMKLRTDECCSAGKLYAWLEGFKMSMAGSVLLTLFTKVLNWMVGNYWVWGVGTFATFLNIGKFLTGVTFIYQKRTGAIEAGEIEDSKALGDYGFYSLFGSVAFIYLFSAYGVPMIEAAALTVDNFTGYTGIALGYIGTAILNPAISAPMRND